MRAFRNGTDHAFQISSQCLCAVCDHTNLIATTQIFLIYFHIQVTVSKAFQYLYASLYGIGNRVRQYEACNNRYDHDDQNSTKEYVGYHIQTLLHF